LACRRFSLLPFWSSSYCSVAVLVCRRFGVSPFWFVAVLTIDQIMQLTAEAARRLTISNSGFWDHARSVKTVQDHTRTVCTLRAWSQKLGLEIVRGLAALAVNCIIWSMVKTATNQNGDTAIRRRPEWQQTETATSQNGDTAV